MNTVGWGGGALGPLFVGWATQAAATGVDPPAKLAEIEAMSRAIATGGIVYLVCAVILVAAMLAGRRTGIASVP